MERAGVRVWQRHLPAKLREQPDGRLLDQLVFGVGVGHGVQIPRSILPTVATSSRTRLRLPVLPG